MPHVQLRHCWQPKPKCLSTDHDPLFRFHRRLANLRVLEIEEIKPVPYAPVSHPFVGRLIGTIRQEYFDRVFFGTPRTWRASCTITKCITTRIESIVRSAARPPRYAPAYRQLFQPRLTVTRGGHIAAVCFRLHRRLTYISPPTGSEAIGPSLRKPGGGDCRLDRFGSGRPFGQAAPGSELRCTGRLKAADHGGVAT